MTLRFELPADKRLAHRLVMPVRWGDMDAFGHVNNTVYFRYMESLRIDWMRNALGHEPGEEGPVVVNAFCNFLRQITFPCDLLLLQYVGGLGRSSVDTYTTMASVKEPDTILAEGGARIVWVNYAQQKSVPLPEALRRAAQGG